ncbi:hypothetical protein JQK87_04825 [Streptomyces sp. G44]|uniref:hypothetical protein n=1 Tax=Streptomyces sp. G44 TaxID=2807632 RepID=UPI001961D3B0|nr:hypothetical protein [Streptomyces sp. G44]MBM7167742.1 hypothetical protein [Streptomyces sp. G44]
MYRFFELRAILAMYTASPHFIPRQAAFDAATGLPPEREVRLQLTSEAVLIFHDGIPLPAVISDDDALHTHAAQYFDTPHRTIFGGGPLVMGGVLLAHPDDGSDQALQFNPLIGWLIVARRDNYQYVWAMHTVRRLNCNAGPAARVLRNYAAINALEGWDTPSRIPGQARPSGKGKKNRPPAAQRRRQQFEQAARTPQARQGALLGVRVLSFTAPPHETSAPSLSIGGPGRAPARYREWRRAHWTRNTRIRLLDAQGRPTGPVYGPGAVENVTFTRRRTRVRGTWVNGHLPPRPGPTPVYAMDERLTRVPTNEPCRTEGVHKPEVT